MAGPRSTVKPRERVLDAAQDLFGAHGIDAVGVDAISERSGVSKSTLYRHFPSKAELVAAYLQRHHERRIDEWVAALGEPGTDPAQRLLGLFDWLEKWFASRGFRGCRFINTRTQLPDPGHPAHGIPQQHKEEIRLLFAELAREGGARDAGELGHELILLVDGAVVHALLEGTATPARRAKALAALAMREHGMQVPRA
jgi:AcrR family transcriptional regulator